MLSGLYTASVVSCGLSRKNDARAITMIATMMMFRNCDDFFCDSNIEMQWLISAS